MSPSSNQRYYAQQHDKIFSYWPLNLNGKNFKVNLVNFAGFSGLNKGASSTGFGGGMARIGDDGELCFWPCFFEVPGAFRGANHVISALNDMAWNMANSLDIF